MSIELNNLSSVKYMFKLFVINGSVPYLLFGEKGIADT